MYKIERITVNGADEDVMYLHATRLRRDAVDFAARWGYANPGKFTRITRI